MTRLEIPPSLNQERHDTHERVEEEGGFQTHPYESRFFFAPFAFFAAILFFRL